MRRQKAVLLGAVAALLVLLLVAAAVVVRIRTGERARDEAAEAAATDLAEAWSAGDLSTARFVGAEPAAVQEQYAALTAGLDGAAPQVEVTSTTREDETATADLTVTWPFGEGWTYDVRAELAPLDADGGADEPWGARFTPALVHPQLAEGDRLTAERTTAPRAEVLGRDGAAIVSAQPVVEIGVQPSRTTDPAGLASQLAGALATYEIDAADLQSRITSASPDAFVPVITLRRSDYDAVRAQVQPLPGTVFREATQPLAPTTAFARALLGRVGPATQELVDASEGRVLPGDTTGVSGLQRQYDAQLTGTPGTAVRLEHADEATPAEELFTTAPVPGQPVRLTLDQRAQQAADAALAGSTAGNGNAALVAVDVPTGDVLAVANTPANGTNRALTGQYPPGSTFKTVTTTALLGTGLTPEETVPCTPDIAVEGRTFRNFEGEAFGDVPFRTDFAQSCNTAFIRLSQRLGAEDLTQAAASLGLGGTWDLGVDAFTGSVPSEGSAVDRAAASIGQGTVLASPASMAVVASTIARGSWVEPHLVTEPAPAAPAGAPAPDAARLAVVRDLMRSVATSGTAAALADVPGAPVHAKTGTAEFGTQDPPQTHAWVIGFQGDLAFAVLVEEGSSGGAAAVPVAEAFLRSLAG